MIDLIQTAVAELGIEEIEGPEHHNERIVSYAKEAGFEWVNDDETPWCSIFLNWVAKRADYEKSDNAMARSWLNVGIKVDNPEPGDIVIYWRVRLKSKLGHVGIFLGYSRDRSRIYTLGGNQVNAVSISAYPKKRLLGFRRLKKNGIANIPYIVLERGDKGPEVVILQDSLKAANFDCGTSDGFFGPITERAVVELQSHNIEIENTGVFDARTRSFLIGLLSRVDAVGS